MATYKRFRLLELARKSKSDIILKSETKLNSRHNLQFKDYSIIRTDRPSSTHGGGTAIMIKDNIQYEQVYYPSSARNKLLEYTIVKVKTNNSKNLFIVSIYATNDGSSPLFIKELEHLLINIKANAHNAQFILAGDFNIKSTKFGNTIANQRGIQFDRWELNASLEWKFKTYIPCEPTYGNSNSFLDICIAESNLAITNTTHNGKLKTLHFDSDHRAITFTLIMPNSGISVNQKQLQTQFNYKATNWSKFSKRLEKNYNCTIPLDRDLNNEEIDGHLNALNISIKKTIKDTTPTFKKK